MKKEINSKWNTKKSIQQRLEGLKDAVLKEDWRRAAFAAQAVKQAALVLQSAGTL